MRVQAFAKGTPGGFRVRAGFMVSFLLYRHLLVFFAILAFVHSMVVRVLFLWPLRLHVLFL